MEIMKTIVFVLTILSFTVSGQTSQQLITRSIEVKGSSEMEITPDEIFVGITIKEYKKGGSKVSLDKLESDLTKAIKRLNIDEDKLRAQNIYGYNWNWRKRRPDDFLGSKNFILEVEDLKKMNDLVDMLDPEGLTNMNVQTYSHSEIESYRKQVKIGAMKAAKEKAAYLLESVDEKVGRILEAQEIEYGYQQPLVQSNMALRMETADSYESNVDFKRIKIRAEMRVVFEIAE